jgi:hypothetical protein
LDELRDPGRVLVGGAHSDEIDVRRLGPFLQDRILGRIEAGLERVVGVDRGSIGVIQRARKLRGVEFDEVELLGILGDVRRANFQSLAGIQLDVAAAPCLLRIGRRWKVGWRTATRHDGVTAIVRATGKAKRTVYRWRDRYIASGIEGLKRDASRPSRKPPLSAEVIKRVVDMTLHQKPPAGTHWSVRKLAKVVGLSPSSVQRIWAAHGLKPHLIKKFKLSNDKAFVEKVQDVVGLLSQPAGQGPGALRRREEPNPGARPHPAGAAHQEGAGRHDDP